ncbi:BolA family protein [Reinekea sp.]|jgi:acid stress-induced BolA-like protein IbaG/YrbA|uniref:BolA family protein n=1 Tax=Reinekea sp. TaxID=1970455 RepID=UPI002A80D7C9|nr:BolA/IbaG family iron-sulfur metabolism protein [Reinekea sp.]
MTVDDIKALLNVAFPDAQIAVEGEGAKFAVTIVAEAFNALRPVPRQQMVYAVLNDYIASGEIHAVSMKLQSLSEAS